ncbi:unnamed protein product [Ectocarpus sp. CCAP 1310/34]|nr:unnamed protein product [Ectocarpus sp. CCAP 1310/34]
MLPESFWKPFYVLDNTTLVRDTCPLTNAALNLPPP